MIENPHTLRSLQLKMIMGYTVIISLFLLVLTFIYEERQEQAQTAIQIKELQTQRQLVENTTVQILNLALLGEEMLAWEKEDIILYSQKRNTLTISLYRLREQILDEIQRERINAIIGLLPLKEKYIFATLDDLQKLRDSYTILHKRIPTIIHTNKKQQEKLTQEIRKSYEKDQKKNSTFLGLFRSAKKSRYLTERENHAVLLENQSQTDIQLRSLVSEIDHTRFESTEKLLAHVDSLSTQNTVLNRQMYQLINDFNQTSQTLQRQSTVTYLQEQKQGLKIISGLGLCAVLLAFLFYRMLLNDLRKRHKIRMELELSNQRNETLSLSRENILLTVSHDLCAPLSTINGYAELMPEEKDEVQRNRYAENILNASHHVIGLANNLLYYYRLEAGKEQPDKETFHPGRVIENALHSFRPLADKKGLGLTAETEGVNTMVEGDHLRLTQILNNLLTNAVKFTQTGYVHVGGQYADGQLHLFVRDTGMGISEERQKRIFKAFERLDVDDTQPGFGLGLSITARLVNLLGGTISVQSREGCGSTFEVCLPMKEAGELKTESVSQVEYPCLSGLKVLLIDDDRMQADMTRRMLARNEVTCDCCQNMKKLTELLRGRRYDLLLTDMQMPETDGYTVLALLRSSNLGQSKDIPVLAVTARTDGETEQLKKKGFAGYLHKPFSMDELLVAMVECTGGRIPQRQEPDFTALLEGEDDRKKILDMFVQDTEKTTADLRKAIETQDYGMICALIHKGAPLWETVRIDIPVIELERLASLVPGAWDETAVAEVRKLVAAVEEAVGKAKKLKEDME